MGDMADYDIEQGLEFLADHEAGHPRFPDPCPYCKNEEINARDEELEERRQTE